MTDSLTPTEIQTVQQLMQGYDAPEASQLEHEIATLIFSIPLAKV